MLPILFTVIGTDNTRILTNAVTRTSIDLPIQDRVAQGLGEIGLHLFASMHVELLMCCAAYALVPLAAVREMAAFTTIATCVDVTPDEPDCAGSSTTSSSRAST